jgi:hypothetical protein
MNKSEDINELSAALAKAQGQIKNAQKDSANPFFKSKYADLASVWEVCRKPLADNGLAVIQSVTSDSEHHYVETMMSHSSGQWITDTVRLTLKDDSMQGLGSAITYARRYQLAAFAGVAPDDDDDGNAASGKQKPQDARTATKPAPAVHTDRQESDAAFEKLESARPNAEQLERIKQGFEILGVTTQAEKGKRVRDWGLSFDNLDGIEDKINELVNLKNGG